MLFRTTVIAGLLLSPVYANGCRHVSVRYVTGCLPTADTATGQQFNVDARKTQDRFTALAGTHCPGWCTGSMVLRDCGDGEKQYYMDCGAARGPKTAQFTYDGVGLWAADRYQSQLGYGYVKYACDVNCSPTHNQAVASQDCNYKFGKC